MYNIAPGSPHTYSQIRAEKAKKIFNSAHTESVKSAMVPHQEARLNHEQPEVQHVISSSTDNSKCTVHKKRKRSTDELSLVISIKRSKLAPVQIEPGRLKLKKKKMKPHSPKSYKISISRQLLNRDKYLSSSMPQLTSKVLQDSIVPANYDMQDTIVPVNNMVDEPVKKVRKHKEKKHKKLLLPVQGQLQNYNER